MIVYWEIKECKRKYLYSNVRKISMYSYQFISRKLLTSVFGTKIKTDYFNFYSTANTIEKCWSFKTSLYIVTYNFHIYF